MAEVAVQKKLYPIVIGEVGVTNSNYAYGDVRRNGAIGNNVADDTLAFLNAIASAPFTTRRIFIPRGTYKITQTLNIKRALTFEGPNGTQAVSSTDAYDATLSFADGIVGILVHITTTTATTTGVPSIIAATTGGDGSIFRNLCIQRGDGTKPVADGISHGVWAKARIRMEDCRVRGFAGNGVHIVATAGSADPLLLGNANNWRLDGVLSTLNAGHGVFLDGSDANAGNSEGVSVTSNSGWGIYDSAFLGNTHKGAHASSNTLGPYQTDSSGAHHVFDGCYSEGGGNPSVFVTPTLVIGGQHAAGMTGAFGYLKTGTSGHLTAVQAGLQAQNVGAAATVTSRVGGDPDNGDLLFFTHSVDAPGNYRLKMNVTHDLEFDYGNSGSAANVPFKISGPLTTRLFGRVSAVLHAFYLDRLWVGSGDNARQITSDIAAPAAGEWARGDIVWNRNAAAGGFAGWICTTSGTPGTWKTFGVISP